MTKRQTPTMEKIARRGVKAIDPSRGPASRSLVAQALPSQRSLKDTRSKRRSQSRLEAMVALQIKVLKIRNAETEYKFHPTRRWKFDFAWPDLMIALEVEGGTRAGGRHNRHEGFEKDCEKYNTAGLNGWTVLRATADMVKDGRAIDFVSKAINAASNREAA